MKLIHVLAAAKFCKGAGVFHAFVSGIVDIVYQWSSSIGEEMNLTEKEAEGPGDILDTASNANVDHGAVEEEKVGESEESVEKVQTATDHWREVEEEEEEEDTVDIEGEATESGGVEYVE